MTDESKAEPNETRTGLRAATRANFEYLVRTLSRRTAGKKYESFVINQIWSQLDDETLRPVAQQYVSRRGSRGAGTVDFGGKRGMHEDSSRAFIDLYFPQLHLGVEVDEGHHAAQDDSDRRRTADIGAVIEDYEEIRIPVDVDDDGLVIEPVMVVKSIERAVDRIRARRVAVDQRRFAWAPQGYEPWRTDIADWQQVVFDGALRSPDGRLFKNNGEIREVFGYGDGNATPSHFITNLTTDIPGHVVWCPSLAEAKADGTLVSTNTGGYLNILFEEDGHVFIGQSTNEPGDGDLAGAADRTPPADLSLEQWGAQEKWDFGRRITFARSTDALGRKGFRFLGVFEPMAGIRRIGDHVYETFRLESDTYELPA